MEMTREEAIKILKELPNSILGVVLPFDTDFDYTQALDMAIEALEKEPILDKIRAEIDGAKRPKNRMSFFRDGIECALEIIDKYKAESEDKE